MKIPTVDNRTRTLSVLIGVVLIALGVWLKQNQWQGAHPDEPRQSSSQHEIVPPGPADQNSGEQLSKDKDAIQTTLLAYAAAVSRHDIPAALRNWRDPTKKLRSAIENTEFMTIQPTNVIYNGGRHAAVEVKMVGKSKGQEQQQYQGTVEMVRMDSGVWVVASTKGLKCIAGCGAVPTTQRIEPEGG